jgi:cellulose synthase/poly-beta-1,6-N-acetylglucosamine synthase-like glycosyltransferase
MLMANGCVVKDGQIIDVRTPRTPIPLFQNLEYMRSYLIGKMGWSAINGMPNVSGGFGLFDRSVAIAAGGYDAPSFAEDMDLITRMVGYMCDFSRPYKIIQIPDTCCWTEGPPNLAMLYRQRTRWARGLFQTLSIHHKMIFKKTYKQMGLLTLPIIRLIIFAIYPPLQKEKFVSVYRAWHKGNTSSKSTGLDTNRMMLILLIWPWDDLIS